MDVMGQRRIRVVLREHPDGLSLTEIADRMMLSPAVTWEALDRLATAGLVRQSRRRHTVAGRSSHVSVWRPTQSC